MSISFTFTQILAFAFILGALIFIHELGHFAVAKYLGIRVEVFSLGFGPRLLGWRRRHTDYRISALPLGGYVKMLGENPDEELKGSREEFLSRSKLERFAVLVMGATLNIVLAVMITAGIYMHGVRVPRYIEDPPVIGAVEEGSPAQKGGLRSLDRILSVGDRETRTWNDLQIAVALNPGKKLPFRIVRDGSERTLEIDIAQTEREAIGRVGVLPYLSRVLVARVAPGGPADRAGLRDEDQILSVAGLDVGKDTQEVSKAIADNKGEPIPIVVQRGREEISMLLQLVAGEEETRDPGFSVVPETTLKKYGPVQAVLESLKYNWRSAGVLFAWLGKFASGQMSPKTLSGPIDIYRFTGEALKGGAIAFFTWMAFISLQLGIINLLPIPVLDGGHVFILLLEGLIRRDLSMIVKERLMQVGLVLLLILMGTVISFDVYKNFIQ